MTTVVETVKEMIQHVMQKNTPGQEKATLGESSQQMLNMLVISPTQRNAIEYRTCGQSENSLWHDHHWGRLTASNFGSIVRRVKPAGPLVAHLLYEKVPCRIAALVWGRDHEKEACAAYCQQTGRTVAARGLIGWLWIHWLQSGWVCL